MNRLPAHDPRTIARDIPGVLDSLFPYLTQGVVTSINRRSASVPELQAVPQELVDASSLQKAMLFEVAVAAAEQLLDQKESIDWNRCLNDAVERQQEHFDAKLPEALSDVDKDISLRVAQSLFTMLVKFQSEANEALIRAPKIPGYQWIASGVGDFSVGTTLIEVKCTSKHFSSSDYRQILMYWLLSYCGAIENRSQEWSTAILANPRLNLFLKLSFDELARITSGGRSKVELVEQFSAILGNRGQRVIA
jgi:hypothetical protein